MGKDVIIACDFADKKACLNFLDKFEGKKPFVKIGMELFYAEGPEIVREIKARGHKIFLDLKLHDIPNTVKKSMAVLSRLDVDMCNLHAAGTAAMMTAAIEGLTREDGTRPLLIAVTQLTSTSEEAMHKDLLIEGKMEDVVMHYAKNAKCAGLDGVVCSPLEAAAVHGACGEGFLIRNARHTLCRRRQGRPIARYHPRESKGNRQRLYSGGQTHNRRTRSRGSI